MKKTFVRHWCKEQLDSALPVTYTELNNLGITTEEIAKGEARGKMKTFGPWQIPISFTALCLSVEWTPEEKRKHSAERDSETAYGIRTLSGVKQEGYCLEGRVSVNGKKVRGFTSSQLFRLPDGKLVNVATIHACL
jgi:hypothetical protein